MRRWTDEDIRTWAVTTFGSAQATPREVLVRCNRELAELLSAIENEAPLDRIAGELADVYVVSCQVPVMMRSGWDAVMNTEGFGTSSTQAGRLSVALALNIFFAKAIGFYHRAWPACGELEAPQRQSIVNETLGVVRSLLDALARDYGVNLYAEVDKKMDVNKARAWAKNENGSFQHVET